MHCPRCKKDLVSKNYESVGVNACAQCAGIWLDQGKLQPILDAHDMNFSPALIEKTLKEAHAGIPKAEVATILSCPRCAKDMHALNYDYNSGIIINVCPQGHGLWFDRDELAEVQIFMEHWRELKEHDKEKWAGMAREARREVNLELDREDAEIQKNLGPIDRALEAIFYHFEKLGRK